MSIIDDLFSYYENIRPFLDSEKGKAARQILGHYISGNIKLSNELSKARYVVNGHGRTIDIHVKTKNIGSLDAVLEETEPGNYEPKKLIYSAVDGAKYYLVGEKPKRSTRTRK